MKVEELGEMLYRACRDSNLSVTKEGCRNVANILLRPSFGVEIIPKKQLTKAGLAKNQKLLDARDKLINTLKTANITCDKAWENYQAKLDEKEKNNG